jgi:hypothetical protein
MIAALVGGGVLVVAARAVSPRLVAVDGLVRFEGAVPEPVTADVSSDDYCTKAHQGRPLLVRTIATGANNALQDVIVYVKEGPVTRSTAVPAEPVVLDQRNCMYEPHALALRVNQTFLVRNSDETLHNVHVSPKLNRQFNLGQPMRGVESKRSFARPEVGIRIACDVHGWMTGVAAVFDHEHFDVTAADGAFSLGELPPGDYVIEAFHETLGTLQQRVSVRAGAPARVEFIYRK